MGSLVAIVSFAFPIITILLVIWALLRMASALETIARSIRQIEKLLRKDQQL
jgi:hypothetical protein